MSLIALTLNWELLWVIFQVAAGLGAVIFVHELGHFVVAKLCGVKCEKFFIGFDIGGWKISRRWGETEYGVGILPLGGYVKMLGQDDNPARIAAEMERARIRAEEGEQREESPNDTGQALTDGSGETSGETFTLDPRSYLAQSVPKRMAIISAGVVMNVIFAFVLAVIAYSLGVKYQPCIVSATVPGSPAWKADIRPGDEIVQIGDRRNPEFKHLLSGVSLGDLDRGVQLTIKRVGRANPVTMTVIPESSRGRPKIGIKPPLSLFLYEENPCYADSPADLAVPSFVGGDQVVAANDRAIDSHVELARLLAERSNQALQMRVRGPVVTNDGTAASEASERVISVAPNPMKRLGLIMTAGEITAVRQHSSAAQAGLVAGDWLEKVDGQPLGDPMTLPERLRRQAVAGDTKVTLTVRRPGARGDGQQVELPCVLRVPAWYEPSDVLGSPLAIPALGIAFRIHNVVAGFQPDSPAARAGIATGDKILSAQFQLGERSPSEEAEQLIEWPFKFSENEANWPDFVAAMQWILPGMTVQLSVESGEQRRQVALMPVVSGNWFVPERGFYFRPLERLRKADSLSEALFLGSQETKESLLVVYRFLRRLIEQQISPRLLGGPIAIATHAGQHAYAGVAMLLIFLTVLSANLAVINFLPIPLLDGGHMVFLILEGILGRPVSEKVVIAFHTLGFVLIVSLMLFAFGLDLGLIPRGL